MKYFFKSILSFAALVCVLYPIFIILWGAAMPKFLKSNFSYQLGAFGFTHTRIRDIKNFKDTDIDVLFIGSSHAYKGFDNRIFTEKGISSFNLGSSGQTPIQTEVLVKRYLNLLNPKLIIYEVYPPPFCSDGVGSSLDILANDFQDKDMFKMAIKTNHIKTYHSYVYCLFSDLIGLNEDYIEDTIRGGDLYVSGGFVESKMKYYKHESTYERKIEFNPIQIESFAEINKIVKQQGIDIYFVLAPITDSVYAKYDLKEYANFIKSYGNFYDFNSIEALDDSLHFLDSHHLNQDGVKIFNREFISEFQKLGILPHFNK